MRTVICDSQLATNIQRCAARVNFYFNMNLREHEVGPSLQKGILVHQFLAEYYRQRKNSGNKLDFLSCGNLALEFAKPLTASLTISEGDINNVFRSLEQYVEMYKFEPMEVLFVEEPFAIELYKNEDEDLRIVYVGVIDLIAKLMGQDQKVYDHKSQSRKSEFLLLDDQFEGYTTATNSNTLTVNVIGLQTSVPVDEKMRRIPLSYTPYLLERWKQHIIYWVKQYLVYKDNQGLPENHQGCNKFQLCEYYQICIAASDAARAWKMKAEYIIGEPWDPTAVLSNPKE